MDAFLSYRRTDSEAVEHIANALKARGIAVWLDAYELIPGEPWQPAVEKALAEAPCVVAFVGPAEDNQSS